uniref:Variant surface glycoprotein 1125.4783 n=1 Tax=Trypanosoma brucei TaxID=5691 RepID=A0A1J0RAX3_9TRYP|nr:variant surface glycoprotein 1125.4783 [Trypanosoma brucei]
MKNKLAIAVLTLIASFRVVKTQKTAEPCSTVCGCAYRLERRTKHYADELEHAKAGVRELRRQFLTSIIAANTGTELTRRKTVPIVAAGAALVSDCEQEISNKEAVTTKLANTSAAAAALLRGLHYISKSNGIYHLKWSTGGNFNNAAKTTQNFAELKTDISCGEQEAEDKDVNDRDPQRSQPDIPDLLNKVHLTNDCLQADPSTNCGSNSLSSSSELKFGLALTRDQPADSATFATAWKTALKVTAADFKLATQAITDANKALQEAKEAPAVIACNKRLANYGDIASTTVYRLFVLKALAGKPMAEKIEPADATLIDSAIEQAYGKAGATYATEYWKEVAATPVPKGDGKSEITEEVKKLQTTASRGAALARIFLKEQVQKQEQEKTSKKVDETKSADCSDKKGTECTGDFLMVEGVCTPKKKGEGENNGKYGTTNTTGRNSFVIYKVSLLLVFLIWG